MGKKYIADPATVIRCPTCNINIDTPTLNYNI